MAVTLAILGVISAVLPFVILYLKKQMEKREHVDTAIGKRDRDVLRDGLDKLRGDKPVPTGSEAQLRSRR